MVLIFHNTLFYADYHLSSSKKYTKCSPNTKLECLRKYYKTTCKIITAGLPKDVQPLTLWYNISGVLTLISFFVNSISFTAY